MAIAMISPNDFSPRNCMFVRNPLRSSQHMVTEEKKISGGVAIHSPSVLFNSSNAFDGISQAELFLT